MACSKSQNSSVHGHVAAVRCIGCYWKVGARAIFVVAALDFASRMTTIVFMGKF